MTDFVARSAFDAFNRSRQGARKMPPWDLLSETDKIAWRAAASAVADALRPTTATCPDGVRGCNCARVHRAG